MDRIRVEHTHNGIKKEYTGNSMGFTVTGTGEDSQTNILFEDDFDKTIKELPLHCTKLTYID